MKLHYRLKCTPRRQSVPVKPQPTKHVLETTLACEPTGSVLQMKTTEGPLGFGQEERKNKPDITRYKANERNVKQPQDFNLFGVMQNVSALWGTISPAIPTSPLSITHMCHPRGWHKCHSPNNAKSEQKKYRFAPLLAETSLPIPRILMPLSMVIKEARVPNPIIRNL